MPAPTLRPYQSTWIDGLRNAFLSGFHSPLGVLPTGAGKTVCFSYLTDRLRKSRKRVVIMAHRSELLDQISETLSKFDVPHGMIAPNCPYDARELVHVASVQTLIKRLDRVEIPDYAIPDEAHHFTPENVGGKILIYWRERKKKMRTVGVTASPLRLDGTGMGGSFDTLVIGPQPRELMDLGALCQYRLFAPKEAPDMDGVGKVFGDYKKAGSATVMRKPSIVGDTIANYRKYLNGAPSVSFEVSVENAYKMAEDFRAAGFTSVCLEGKIDRTLRRNLVADFKRGAINVVTSADLISEGFDLPGIVGTILRRPTMSLSMYLQQIGRGSRPFPGKTHWIILDQVNNSRTHGMPDADREWSLIGAGQGKTKAGAAAVRQCEQCFAMSPAAAHKCRDCGATFPIKAREVTQVDGELEEIEFAKMHRAEVLNAEAMAKHEDKLKYLISLGQQRRMKNPEGWARHVIEGQNKARLQKIADELARRAKPIHATA